MHRFHLTTTLLALLLPISAIARTAALQKLIENMLKDRQAEVGVAVIIDGRDTIAINNDRKYPMASVMKFHQALAVADYLQRRGLPVDTMIHVGMEEMRPETWSPMRDDYPDGEVGLTIRELLAYTLGQSDNNACDVLYDRTGGPAATDRYIRSLGIDGFAISYTEADMHEDPSRSAGNWTTPLAAAQLMERFAAIRDERHGIFDYIFRIMADCRTGTDRLPKPLQGSGATVAHKTGTDFSTAEGHPAGINDLGLIVLPDGRHYSIAVFIKESKEDMAATEGIIAAVSDIVYHYLISKHQTTWK